MATRDTSSISNNMTETKTNNEEIIKNIKWVLEEKVKPSVAQHNGVINFISFDDGVVKLEMAGSCSGKVWKIYLNIMCLKFRRLLVKMMREQKSKDIHHTILVLMICNVRIRKM